MILSILLYIIAIVIVILTALFLEEQEDERIGEDTQKLFETKKKQANNRRLRKR